MVTPPVACSSTEYHTFVSQINNGTSHNTAWSSAPVTSIDRYDIDTLDYHIRDKIHPLKNVTIVTITVRTKYFDCHQGDMLRNTYDSQVVVGYGTDRPGHMSTMLKPVFGVIVIISAIVSSKIPAVVVNFTMVYVVLIYIVVITSVPHIVLEVIMIVVYSGVDYCNNDWFWTALKIPGFLGIDIGINSTTVLPPVLHRPQVVIIGIVCTTVKIPDIVGGNCFNLRVNF